MELTGYLAVARRWWWTLLVATWVAALAGVLVASRITPTYEAQVQMLVGPVNTDIDTLKASGLLVQTYAQLAISPPLLQSTAREFPGVDPLKLGQAVRTTASDVTRVLQIRVQDSDPARAAKIANSMADELIQITSGATTRPEGQLEVIGSAVEPTTPIAPQISLIVLLAMAAGLIGGLVLVIVVEYATDTVRDRSDLARLSGTDVLATIAFDARVPGAGALPMAEATAPSSASAVAFRLLASKVAFAESDLPMRTIMVAGVGDGDSAVVATGIAAAVAGSGLRAVVIDGSPDGDISASLGLAGLRGLGEVVAQRGGAANDALVAGPAGISILPHGGQGTAELIAVDRARAILDELLRDADLVIVDGGSMKRSAGALSWARAAQQTILLVRRGSSQREDLRLAVESLRFVNATIGGTVLVQRSPGRGFSRQSGRRQSQTQTLGQTKLNPQSRPAPRMDTPSEVVGSAERAVLRQPTPPTVVRTASGARFMPEYGTSLSDAPADWSSREPEPPEIKARPPRKPSPDIDENRPIRRTTPRARRTD